MISHNNAGESSASKIAVLEAENMKLRGELSHRTSQLHSAVARIAALKERIDDLLRRVDEVTDAKERQEQKWAAKEKRRKARAESQPNKLAEREALGTLLGTQDTMLSAIENLSAVPTLASKAGVVPLAWVEVRPQSPTTKAPSVRRALSSCCR